MVDAIDIPLVCGGIEIHQSQQLLQDHLASLASARVLLNKLLSTSDSWALVYFRNPCSICDNILMWPPIHEYHPLLKGLWKKTAINVCTFVPCTVCIANTHHHSHHYGRVFSMPFHHISMYKFYVVMHTQQYMFLVTLCSFSLLLEEVLTADMLWFCQSNFLAISAAKCCACLCVY